MIFQYSFKETVDGEEVSREGSVIVGEMVTMVFPLKIGGKEKEFTFHYSLIKDKRIEAITGVKVAVESYLRQAGLTEIDIKFEETELEESV